MGETKMKILITYYTQTGNTEKVAKSIKDGISGENPELKSITNINADSLSGYDLIFMGSPTHANGLPKATKNFLKTCPEDITGKIALFYTHGSSEKPMHANFLKNVSKILDKKNIQILDSFDCVGENKDEQVIKMLRAAMPDVIDEMLKKGKGHPNEQDLARAKEFAQGILDKISAKAEL
jgi:flavodoxin I